MASTSTRPESSISSSSLPLQFLYDVFLSFRGEDTRKNFTDHLYSALVRHGFSTFRDDNEVKTGEEIGPELLISIERSRISVIVFSRNYAASRRCLDLLVKILECKKQFKQTVLPIFYDVDPSDVRAQRGSFAEAFAKHEERYEGSEMEGKVEGWRAALTEAANLSGFDLQNIANGYESKFIEKIIEDLSKKLDLRYANVVDYPVSLESRVQEVNMLLSLGSDDVRIVGIWGIGGIGKTTIAKAIYNLIRLKFEGSSFLANVREISKRCPSGLVALQEQLLSDILMNEIPKRRNVYQGIEYIKRRLWCRRVLIVLDDVDEFNQLKALAIRRDWFHSRSRIIITTRDESILKFLEVDNVYEPKLLTYDESLRLFSWHAFRKDHPLDDYVELSREVVNYAGGLPLVLEVLGSSFFDKSILEWKNALEKLKVNPHDTVQEKLKISFDSLNDDEKNIFLDIACFFVGMDKNYIVSILEGCGFFPEIGIGILSRRCLVRFDTSNELRMHDMLQDMGREIARKECLEEPGKRSRLCLREDVLDVLTSHTGTEEVEGLALDLPRLNDVQVNAQAFAKMNRLRLLKLNYVHLSGSYGHFSERLRWLCWFGFPLKCIPPNLFMEKVVAIDMSYSSLKQVWKGKKFLSQLKFLTLSHSHHLTETPDFSSVTNLEMLLLNDCTSLVEVHQSIECLNKLVTLDLENCKNLGKLPLGIWNLRSLENLSLSGCSKLKNVPGFKGSQSKSWFSLLSSWASLVKNPDSISLSPAFTQGFISITVLSLSDCNLSYVPHEFGSLISLEQLDLDRNDFCTLPASIINLSCLLVLSLSDCPRLQSLPELPPSLATTNADNCESLESISTGSEFHALKYMNLDRCNKFVEGNLASNFRKSLLQKGLFALPKFNILLPGGEVPDYFNYQSVGSVLSFVVSELPNRKIRGSILCVVFAGHIDEVTDEAHLHYNIENKTRGSKYKTASYGDFPLTLQDQTWLHYASDVTPEVRMAAGDEMEYSAVMCPTRLFQVKRCGVNLIYEDDEKDYLSKDQGMIKYESPWYRHAILDKNVSADQGVIDNKIMATAEGTGGDDPTRRSTPLPGRPSSEEKGKAIATESDEWSPTHRRKLRKGTGIVIVDHVVPDVPEAPTDSGSPKRERSALDSPGDGAPPFCG